MATLVFTAAGTAFGGPLGGVIGGLAGRQVDAALFGPASRHGPRLDDLRISTSSYGNAIPRHFGAVRMPGTVIWATDLVEHSQSQSGGKGSPSATTYSYSVSLAVALASRPILRIGKIWADGNLLRGEESDLKAGGQLRVYSGHGDHGPDPLLASAEGAGCPAFRGLAYAVFEDLDLSGFGNRIPALSFEILADEGPLTLAPMLAGAVDPSSIARPLPGLAGFSCAGGPLTDVLATIDAAYPLACDASGQQLRIFDAEARPANAPLLPEPTVTEEEGSFGQANGRKLQRQAGDGNVPMAIRYFDSARDYLTGMQRADGRARSGRELVMEFPGTLKAADARRLANESASRAARSRETMAWRVAELDPAVGPGSVVRVPGHSGYWRITGWEWRTDGIELELMRLPHGSARKQATEPGRNNPAQDLPAGTSELVAFDLPWDGLGTGDMPHIHAALSSPSPGWAGAQILVERSGSFIPLGSSRKRALIGQTLTALPPAPAIILDRQARVTVRLTAADLALDSVTLEQLAGGANCALIGTELLQFASATALGNGEWLLEGLLRGRGGTEWAALTGQSAGSHFVLLDHRLTPLDLLQSDATPETVIAAIGLGDSEPVTTTLVNAGLGQRPLTPVHPRCLHRPDGEMILTWVRRARGAWEWRDEVDVPLNEDDEAYAVGLGPVDNPIMRWETTQPRLAIGPPTAAAIALDHAGQPLWVRHTGRFAQSDPLLITII
ncbi:hypothetical protein MB02_06390 [Croceicoccus estronivorus]|uniref:phage tail protein n=1 Tax=Croceicoccus estronivorus TaxID=1172626 RepID=UPI00082C9412|nr:phage tail protein [Croceicoccus estronivorus]OCC24238.1 hypothetical protein MB02_06390 [Croceicoccus estronivorus]